MNYTKNYYFSLQNKNNIYNLVAEKINKDYDMDISTDLQSFPILEQIMLKVFKLKNSNENNEHLSKKAIQVMIKYYVDKSKVQLPLPGLSNNDNFDEIKSQNQNPAYESEIKENINFETKLSDNDNILKNFDQLTQERNNESGKEIQNQFTSDNESTNISFTNQFNSDKNDISYSPNVTFNVKDTSKDINLSDIKSDNQDTDINHLQNTHENIQIDNLKELKEIIEKKNEENVKKNDLDQFFQPLIKLLEKKNNDYRIITHKVIINSWDRKWYGEYQQEKEYNSGEFIGTREDFLNKYGNLEQWNSASLTNNVTLIKSDYTTRYNYRIHFNNDAGNNMTEYDSNGNRMEFTANGSIGVNRRFRNIDSFCVKKLLMPNLDEYLSNENNNQVYIGSKTEPFLYIAFDEYNSNLITSSKNVKNPFSKVVMAGEYNFHDIDYKDNSGDTTTDARGYIIFIDEEMYIKQFYPSPLADLDCLTFNLLRANGQLYSDVKDDLEIIHINSQQNALYFILTLNQKVEQHYFKQGDRVLIKNLTDQSGNHITGLTSKFYDYIETGAYIHSKADSTYTNQVFVHFPVDGYQNLNANANDIDKYLYQSSKNNDINTDAHGFIMNMSKQHSLVIEINEKVFNSDTTINSEIV